MATGADIEAHYDEEFELFRTFLDNRHMAYSCGVWDDAHSLEDAQSAKLRRIADYARVHQGSSILDVGCGWGGMMEFCVTKLGAAHAIGITLSPKQYRHIQQTAPPNIVPVLESWETYLPSQPVDAIVSIGAFEHFASLPDRKLGRAIEKYRSFFEFCQSASSPHARVGLQTIVTSRAPDSRQSVRDVSYLARNVFPGSVLPMVDDIRLAAQGLYEVNELKLIGLDYSRTLEQWDARLVRQADELASRFGSALVDHFHHYFNAAKRQFDGGYVNLAQMSLRRI